MMTGQQIYDNFKRARGTESMETVRDELDEMRRNYEDLSHRFVKVGAKIEDGWTGDAADVAQRGVSPLAVEHASAAAEMGNTVTTLDNQVKAFHKARNDVVPVPPKPESPPSMVELGGSFVVESIAGDDAMNTYMDKMIDHLKASEHNKQVMEEWNSACSANSSLPDDYGSMDKLDVNISMVDQSTTAGPAGSVGGVGGISPGGGGGGYNAPGYYGGGSASGYGGVSGTVTPPPSGGGNYVAPAASYSPGGGGNYGDAGGQYGDLGGSYNDIGGQHGDVGGQRGDLGGEYGDGSTSAQWASSAGSYSDGYGGAGRGFGGYGAGGYGSSGYSTGSYGAGGYSSGGYSSGGYSSGGYGGSAYGAGSGSASGSRVSSGRVTGAAPTSATTSSSYGTTAGGSSSGSRGMGRPMMGGMGGRGQGGDDEEHERKYVEDDDSMFELAEDGERLVDPRTGMPVAPDVIGEAPKRQQ